MMNYRETLLSELILNYLEEHDPKDLIELMSAVGYPDDEINWILGIPTIEEVQYTHEAFEEVAHDGLV